MRIWDRKRSFLLVGDETGLPAIASILELLPANAHVTTVVEIAHEERHVLQTKVCLMENWLVRAQSNAFRSNIYDFAPTHEDTIWVTSESSIVYRLRSLHAEKGIGASERVRIAGYWKRGQADFKYAS